MAKPSKKAAEDAKVVEEVSTKGAYQIVGSSIEKEEENQGAAYGMDSGGKQEQTKVSVETDLKSALQNNKEGKSPVLHVTAAGPEFAKLDVKGETKADAELKSEQSKNTYAAGTPANVKFELDKKESAEILKVGMPKNDEEQKKVKEDKESTGKRTRKSTEQFTPDAFHTGSDVKKRKGMENLEIEILPGRGDALGSINGMGDTMKTYGDKNPALLSMAHRFVLGGKGKMQVVTGAKKMAVLREKLLKFSGYLPPLPPQKDDEERDKVQVAKQEELDAKEEDKMSVKAMKLSKPQLVDLCNFFDVDRTVDKGEPSLDKEGVINRLLDFLGEPDEGLTRTYNGRSATGNAATIKGRKKKATGKNTKKEIQKAVEAEVVSSDHTSTDEEVESGTSMDKEVENEKVEDGKGEKGETIVAAKKKGLREAEQNGNAKGAHKLPSEKDLRKWVKAYVACFNLNKATINHAIETASEKFGVNVSSKKAILKTLLTEEIRKQIHVD